MIATAFASLHTRVPASCLLVFAMHAAFAADAPSDDVVARDLAASCAACHGTQGRSAGGFPVLAGVDRLKITDKLNGFRSGTLPASVMHQHAKGYSDREVDLLAEYFSKQPPTAQQ